MFQEYAASETLVVCIHCELAGKNSEMHLSVYLSTCMYKDTISKCLHKTSYTFAKSIGLHPEKQLKGLTGFDSLTG